MLAEIYRILRSIVDLDTCINAIGDLYIIHENESDPDKIIMIRSVQKRAMDKYVEICKHPELW